MGASTFLDALVALRMLERGADEKYSNTPETDLFLDRAKPSYDDVRVRLSASEKSSSRAEKPDRSARLEIGAFCRSNVQLNSPAVARERRPTNALWRRRVSERTDGSGRSNGLPR